MTSQHLLRSVLLGCLVFIRVRTARCGDPKPAAIPPAPITVDRRDAKSSIVLIGAQVIEIQGDVKGALKQAGFGYFTQINRTREGDTSFFFRRGWRERAQVESGSPRYPQEESRYDCSVQLPYEDRHGAIGKSHTQHGSQQNAVFGANG